MYLYINYHSKNNMQNSYTAIASLVVRFIDLIIPNSDFSCNRHKSVSKPLQL